jgi:hypothetical protein
MATQRSSRVATCLLPIALAVVLIADVVAAQTTPATTSPTTTPSVTPTSNYYSALDDLSTPAPKSIGSQNFTRCCLQAVRDWQAGETDITVAWGEFSKNPSYVFAPDSLSSSGAGFPCGNSYTDNPDGAPEVLVTYSWCKSNCGGWQQSTNADLAQWIIPFIGFILPAAVFCLNVSRITYHY